MVIFDLLKTFVFLVSGILLYPTLVLLSLAAVYTVWLCGRFLGEWRTRAQAGTFDPARDRAEDFVFVPPVRAYRDKLLAMDRHDEAAVLFVMRQAVAEREKSLDLLRLLIRIAPALGLLGTLIPMGSALAGVGQGEFHQVSGELVIAFTTTVVGLAAGSIAYALHTVKRRWVAADVRLIEYLTEVLSK